MKLVDDARNWWRWTSMRGMALAGSIVVAWEALGDDLKAYLPHWVGAAVAVFVLATVGMGGRVLKQKPKDQ
jgi:hypothetical protein